ncbi:MAG: hypothetical protein WAV13_04780, partial [Thermodesulfovibrionales bacterium]
YSSKEKEYLNTVISLMTYKHIPRSVVEFFAGQESAFKGLLLKLFIGLYRTAVKVQMAFLR